MLADYDSMFKDVDAAVGDVERRFKDVALTEARVVPESAMSHGVVELERNLDGLQLPKPNRITKRPGPVADGTQEIADGRHRLESGVFVAMRGHGIKSDGNTGVVMAVQAELVKLGLLGTGSKDEVVIDGKFGGQTERAVHDFQVRYNSLVKSQGREDLVLTEDGKVGRQTWDALKNTKRALPAVEVPPARDAAKEPAAASPATGSPIEAQAKEPAVPAKAPVVTDPAVPTKPQEVERLHAD